MKEHQTYGLEIGVTGVEMYTEVTYKLQFQILLEVWDEYPFEKSMCLTLSYDQFVFDFSATIPIVSREKKIG